MAKNKFLKTVFALGALGVASKVAYDKYKDVKSKFEQEESESAGAEVKKYNAIFQNKVVEVDDEEFTGCEINAIGSKAVIDLGLAVFEKDVYIDFTSKASSVTIVLPEGVNAACDVEQRVSTVTNLVENTDEEGIHTVYIIGKADASRVQIVPVDFYVDDEDDFEDFVDEENEDISAGSKTMEDAEKEASAELKKSDIKDEVKTAEAPLSVEKEVKSASSNAEEAESKKKTRGRKKASSGESENDDLENVENPEDEDDLRKIDGAEELTMEEVTE